MMIGCNWLDDMYGNLLSPQLQQQLQASKPQEHRAALRQLAADRTYDLNLVIRVTALVDDNLLLLWAARCVEQTVPWKNEALSYIRYKLPLTEWRRCQDVELTQQLAEFCRLARYWSPQDEYKLCFELGPKLEAQAKMWLYLGDEAHLKGSYVLADSCRRVSSVALVAYWGCMRDFIHVLATMKQCASFDFPVEPWCLEQLRDQINTSCHVGI